MTGRGLEEAETSAAASASPSGSGPAAGPRSPVPRDIEVLVGLPRGVRRLTLGRRLGPVGSQGEVREVPDVPSAVVKLVRAPGRFRLAERLDALLAEDPGLAVRRGGVRIGWPVARVSWPDGTPAGYLQPRLGAPLYLPLSDVFDDRLRAARMPGTTWRWFLAVAADLCDLVERVAARGHVIGDLAPENLFADVARAAAVIIDVDGWQLARPGREPLPCPFSRAEYTPPEHLDAPDDGSLRRPEADHWALAVVVGQILSLGCHPYAGIAPGQDPPFDEQANVRSRRSWLTGAAVSLPVGTPPSTLLPASLLELFSACFEAGWDEPGRRPSPRMWREALQAVSANLTQCPARPMHVYPAANQCPWCAVVEAGGPERFPAPPSVPEGGGRR